MLKTNKEAISDFKRLNKPSRGEIIEKLLSVFDCSESMLMKRFDKGSFTLNERNIFDDTCQPYFDIMPEVLESNQELEEV